VAVLLVAVATTWGGVLWSLHRLIEDHVLAPQRSATIVAVARSPERGAEVLRALLAAHPAASGVLLRGGEVREELVRWFPELATVLLGLEEASFPSLVQIDAPAELQAEVARWLSVRQEISLVANSHDWESRVQAAATKVAAVGFALAAALLVGCSVVVLLVVRLLVLEHADEIAIMRLIGAHNTDIRMPYLLCGFCLGSLGGAVGAAALSALAAAIADALPAAQLPPAMLPVLPLVGGLAGLFGALLGLAALPDEP